MADAEGMVARRGRGFRQAGALLREPVARAGERRGFAQLRLLTHWPEIVGEETARVTRPLRISWGREGFGATLLLLVAPAAGPMVQMQLPLIREKVNACYGYNAIARISLTQTAPQGFAEGRSPFAPAPRAPAAPPAAPDPDIAARAAEATACIRDPALRAALEALGRNVLSRAADRKGL